MNQYTGNKLDRAVAYRQETTGSGRWRGFKFETSFEWGTTRICTRAFYINDLEEWGGGVTLFQNNAELQLLRITRFLE